MQRVAAAGDVTIVEPEIVHDATFDEPITDNDDDYDENDSPADDPCTSRPIYQLPPYSVVWNLPRPEAKTLGKFLASPALFGTASREKKAKSKKSLS